MSINGAMPDQLVAIPIQDLPNLRDLYKTNWPVHHVGYYTIDNYIRWFNQDPEIPHVIIYSLNGNWSDGTFIIVDGSHIMINSLDESNESLLQMLSLVDWSHGYTICAYVEKHRSTVGKFFKNRALKTSEEWPALWYFLSKDEGKNVEIEPLDGITLKPLSVEHAEIADELWPHRYEGSLDHLKRIITMNLNIGAFTADDELVGWCLRMEYGSLAVLQVKESHQRKGIATVLVKFMIKALCDQNKDTFASVLESNNGSRILFEKLGFKVIDNVYWMNVQKPIAYANK